MSFIGFHISFNCNNFLFAYIYCFIPSSSAMCHLKWCNYFRLIILSIRNVWGSFIILDILFNIHFLTVSAPEPYYLCVPTFLCATCSLECLSPHVIYWLCDVSCGIMDQRCQFTPRIPMNIADVFVKILWWTCPNTHFCHIILVCRLWYLCCVMADIISKADTCIVNPSTDRRDGGYSGDGNQCSCYRGQMGDHIGHNSWCRGPLCPDHGLTLSHLLSVDNQGPSS